VSSAILAADMATLRVKGILMTLDEINTAILEKKRKRADAEALADSPTRLSLLMHCDKQIDELESLRIYAQ
jgi:hypothetical protein